MTTCYSVLQCHTVTGKFFASIFSVSILNQGEAYLFTDLIRSGLGLHILCGHS